MHNRCDYSHYKIIKMIHKSVNKIDRVIYMAFHKFLILQQYFVSKITDIELLLSLLKSLNAY